MNVIVLDYQENFITFLDNDLLDITEHYEIGGIRYIDVEYYMQEITDARKLFKIGNKIWIQNDPNLTDCLYVINSEVKRDYFKKNNVSFTAEDVIVELNYAPFFKQTDLTASNGFTLSSNAGEMNVKVDYKALDYWFGDYFNIGIVQNTLNTEISKISPTGTMTKMQLLRYIEEQTCNIFIPRYEKDINSNVIHRFLDYLNPNSNDTNWTVTFKWEPVDTTATNTGTIPDNEDVQTKNDLINLPEYIPLVNHEPANITVSLKDDQDEVIEGLTWNGEDDLGMDDDSDVIEVTIKYQKPTLTASVNNRSYTASGTTPEDRNIDSSTTTVISFPAGGTSRDESNLSSTVAEATLGSYSLPSPCWFEVYDTETDDILYRHKLEPVCGEVHEDILDLAYNVENITYTLNEEDTFTAISPKIKTDGTGNSNALTYEDYDAVINNWINLSVNKGDVIPMIVERMTVEAQPTDNYLALSTIDSNYYARPLKPNDNSDNNQYEYWKATAYWTAPYTKVAGEMHIEDPEATGVEYNHIQTRPDTTNPYGVVGSPKLGIVETSDENKYAIYNDVAMKLKDKRYPEIKIDVDVANYKDGKYNDYHIYDKVFVKIPGYAGLVTAIVEKTSKQGHNIGKNTVSLTNFQVNTKVSTKETMLIGDNVSYEYPGPSSLPVTLKDISGETEVALANKLLNMTVYKVDDNGTENYRKTYTKLTNASGVATLPIALAPGNYIIRCEFGGDVEYTSTSADFQVNSSGVIDLAEQEAKNTKTTTSSTTTIRYYDKYGRSPDKKKIIAIGRPSGTGELSQYGYKFYKTEFNCKCPHCGSTDLYWGIFWAGNETSNWGKFPGTGRSEGGSAEGHIFCKKCDADWSVFGKDHGTGRTKNLTVTKKATATTKAEAYTLKNGKLEYDKVTTTTTSVNNSKTTRNHTPVGSVDKKVKEWALKKVGSSEGAAAAKKLAQAVGKLRYDSYANFVRSPSTVLSKGGGNCCDQARLLAMCCDAVGVTADYNIKYVHVCCNSRGMGHVFLRLVKKSDSNSGTYMDPVHSPWWNTYLTGWGRPPGRQSVYPKTPF